MIHACGTAACTRRVVRTIAGMIKPTGRLVHTILSVACDFALLLASAIRSRAQLSAENLFLRKQLAMYQERRVKPRRADDVTKSSSAIRSSPHVRFAAAIVAITPEQTKSCPVPSDQRLRLHDSQQVPPLEKA